MAKSVLLDTSFLITLLDGKRSNHDSAKRYLRWFLDQKYILWLSTIVISEYCHRGTVDELPLRNLKVLPFDARHAVRSAELNFKPYRQADGTGIEARDTAKDDFKILAQAAVVSANFLMTDDENSLYKYAERLRNEGKLDMRCIRLADGFDVALVNDDQQRELPDTAE
jgi:predicted nucleic acid-binding protein